MLLRKPVRVCLEPVSLRLFTSALNSLRYLRFQLISRAELAITGSAETSCITAPTTGPLTTGRDPDQPPEPG